MSITNLFKFAAMGIVCLALAGCAQAGADDDYHNYINEDIVLQDGYYTCENDDSFIHIENGKIELCNFDMEADAIKIWDELMGKCDDEERKRQEPHRDEFIENSVNTMKNDFALREFTPVSFPFPDETFTMLVWDYEWAQTVGTYTGYDYYDDGSIGKVGNTYYYYGTELPE